MIKNIFLSLIMFFSFGNMQLFAQWSSYLSDKKPFKQIHLYKVKNKYYVSGLNKDIDSLTINDMALLRKKSKVIEYDINLAKKYLNGNAQITDNDSCEIRANLHGIGYANIVLYMQDHLSKRKFDGFDTSVIFVIESDGSLTCPIVISGRNVDENKEVIRVLRKTSKKWIPAQKNGYNVRTMQGYRFSFELKTYTIREHFRF